MSSGCWLAELIYRIRSDSHPFLYSYCVSVSCWHMLLVAQYCWTWSWTWRQDLHLHLYLNLDVKLLAWFWCEDKLHTKIQKLWLRLELDFNVDWGICRLGFADEPGSRPTSGPIFRPRPKAEVETRPGPGIKSGVSTLIWTFCLVWTCRHRELTLKPALTSLSHTYERGVICKTIFILLMANQSEILCQYFF